MNHIAVDFETFYRAGKKATPSIKAQGTYGYTHDPEFEVLIISVCDGDSVWSGEPRDFNWDALQGRSLISHNAAFDRAVYRRLVEDGLAPVGLEADWNCSANLTACLSGGAARSLKHAAAKWLDVTVSKDVRDALSGKRVADLKADGTWEATLKYADDDAIHCWRLWEKLAPTWPEVEHEASLLTLEHSVHGIFVDRPRLVRDIASLQEAIWLTEKVLPWTERGAKPTSPIAIAEECRRVGIPTPPVKDDDEEGFILWEAAHGPKYPWVSGVGRLRSLKKVLSGHEHVASRIRPDGRFDFGLLYWGAHTGRWSGTGGYNVQNMRARPLVVDLANHGTVLSAREAKGAREGGSIRVIDQRALFTPAPGHDMVLVDLAQIEPRLLHWVTGNNALLEKVATGMSIYEAYARVTPAGSPLWTRAETLKDADPDLYKAVKIQVLQLGYGSGGQKFLAQALEAELEMDLAGAEKVVKDFREANKGITKLWETMGAGFQIAGHAKEDYYLDLPNGRAMCYERVRRALQRMEVITHEDGSTESKPRFGWCANVAGRTAFFYGGKLTENFIQAMAREVFALKVVELRRRGFKVLWTIHDEAVIEYPGDSKGRHREILDIMRAPVEWLPKCPLDAELKVVAHYKK